MPVLNVRGAAISNVRELGYTVWDQIVSEYHDSMLEEAEDEEWTGETRDVNPFVAYQGFPVEFCEQVFKVSLTHEVKDMLLSAQKNPNTLAKSANGVGKTFAAALFVLYWFLVYDDAQVYTIAAPPEENLRLLLWGEISAFVTKHAHLFGDCKISLASLKIERMPKDKKSFIVGLAIPQSANKDQLKARFSGKHAPHLLFVADEADGVPAPIFEAIETCMSGGMARQLLLFNPRSETCVPANMENEGDGKVVTITAFSHPNVVTGKDVIPGAVSREITVRRINLWSTPISQSEARGGDTFEIPKFLVGYVAHRRNGEPMPPLKEGWRRIVEPSLSYMVLARYPAQGENQLISTADVDAAISRWMQWASVYGEKPPPGTHPFLSHDVAELGEDSNVVTLFFGNWVAPQIEWRGVDVKQSGIKAAGIYKSNMAQWINVDATGVGAGAWAELKSQGCTAYRIMVSSTIDIRDYKSEFAEAGFDSVRSQMLWDLREWFRTEQAMIPPDRSLRAELIAATYNKNPRGLISVCNTDTLKEKLNGKSPDKLMSMGLRFAKQPRGEDKTVVTGNYAVKQSLKPKVKAGLGMPSRR